MRTVNRAVHARQTGRIMRTALRLFAHQGYGVTSMGDISRACGMQKASLYHYFKSKEELLRQIIDGHIAYVHSKSRPTGALKCSMEQCFLNVGMSFLRDMHNPDQRHFLQLLIQDAGTNSFVRRTFFTLAQQRVREAGYALKPQVRFGGITQRGHDHFRTMHQFLSALMRYAVEKFLWKAGPAMMFSEKEYVSSLSRLFARGLRMVVALLATLPMLAAAPAPAEDALSLEQYMAQVWEKGPALEAARQSRRGLELKPLEFSMVYSPVFNASYSFADSKSEPTSLLSPDRAKSTSWSLGLSKKWFTGTSMSLAYGMNQTELFYAPIPASLAPMVGSFLPPSETFTAKPTFSVSQSLLRDFMGGITDGGIDKTKHAMKAGERMQAYGEQASLMGAEMAYWSLALARETVGFKKQALERTQRLRDWTERRARLNLTDPADLLQTEAALRLVTLDLRMAEENAELAARKFNSARGMEGVETPANLDPIADRIGRVTEQPVQSMERLDVQASRESLESAKATAKETFYRSLPDLSVFGSIGWNGYDTTQSAAHEKAMDQKWPVWAVGATFVAPLDLITLAKVRRGYDSDYEGAKASFAKAELEANQDWANLTKKWNDVRARLELAREIVKLQEERLAADQKRLENGRILTYQFIATQGDLANAQLTYLGLGLEKLSVEAQARMFNSAYGPQEETKR